MIYAVFESRWISYDCFQCFGLLLFVGRFCVSIVGICGGHYRFALIVHGCDIIDGDYSVARFASDNDGEASLVRIDRTISARSLPEAGGVHADRGDSGADRESVGSAHSGFRSGRTCRKASPPRRPSLGEVGLAGEEELRYRDKTGDELD